MAETQQKAEGVLSLGRAGFGRDFQVGPDADDVRLGFVVAALPSLEEPIGGEAGVARTAGVAGRVPATEQLHGASLAAAGELGAERPRRAELLGIERGNNFG